MHEIRKRSKVKDVFHIIDDDGRELTVESILEPGVALPSWNRAKNSIIRLETAGSKDAEALGRAIVDTFAVFFGEEGTAKILEFYEDDYMDMMRDVFPYVQTFLLPKLEEESAKRRENMIDIYRNSYRRREL